MPDLNTYHLHFYNSVHLGRRSTRLEESGIHLPSDTLFAALLDVWRHLGENVAKFADPFVGEDANPPFILSSAFPLAGTIRFYPMPVDLQILFSGNMLRARGKEIKRIGFLSEYLLQKALKGERLDNDLFPDNHARDTTTGIALQRGMLWLHVEEIDRLPEHLRPAKPQRQALRFRHVWRQEQRPRVTIDRIRSASTIFQSGHVRFAAECGLWFGINWRQPEAMITGNAISYQQALPRLLTTLGDGGVGGERSTGNGAFAWQQGNAIRLQTPLAGMPAYLLSRYHPRRQELPGSLSHPDAAYRIVSIGGWLRSPDSAARRRRTVPMVSEGSIICPPAYPAGDLCNAEPEGFPHPVYRAGFALTVDLASQRGEPSHV